MAHLLTFHPPSPFQIQVGRAEQSPCLLSPGGQWNPGQIRRRIDTEAQAGEVHIQPEATPM